MSRTIIWRDRLRDLSKLYRRNGDKDAARILWRADELMAEGLFDATLAEQLDALSAPVRDDPEKYNLIVGAAAAVRPRT